MGDSHPLWTLISQGVQATSQMQKLRWQVFASVVRVRSQHPVWRNSSRCRHWRYRPLRRSSDPRTGHRTERSESASVAIQWRQGQRHPDPASCGPRAVDGRLAELQARRAELETQAAALAEQVRNQQFYATDDLTGSQGSFDALQAEIELFGAQQAMDELAQAEQRLQGERQRLEADAEAVALRIKLNKTFSQRLVHLAFLSSKTSIR